MNILGLEGVMIVPVFISPPSCVTRLTTTLIRS